MQQAFQKNAMGLQTGQNKQASQTNLNLSQNYTTNNRQQQKNDVYNFATVTANTGNMIVNNKPLTSKLDPHIAPSNIVTKAQTQNRMSNKSKCLSDSKHAYNNVSAGQNHLASKSFNQSNPKYNQSNHHTLQCISDINEFKQKINMVLQTQAFPSGIQQVMNNPNSANEAISTKQLAANAHTGSLNPTSRLGYSQPLKHESPQPNFSKSHMFQKRTIKTQNQAIYDAEMSKDFDNQVSSAFQSFKQNIKNQGFVNETGELQDQAKMNQGYLLRGQKDKNRNQYQQFKNAQSNSVQSTGEFGQHTGNVINNKLHQINNEIKQIQSVSKKGYISNMLAHQQQQLNNTGGYSAQLQNSQRRKLLIDYNIQKTSEQQSRMQHQSPIDNLHRNSRQNRNSVFSNTDINQIQRIDFLDQLNNINIELMDDKDKECLKEVCISYCTDLRLLVQQQDDRDYDPLSLTNVSTKHISDLVTESKEKSQSALETNENGRDDDLVKSVQLESSEQKFKENEKNLKEERLTKESKIELPLALENRKIIKAVTPVKSSNENDKIGQKLEEINSLKHEENIPNLKMNQSQQQLSSIGKEDSIQEVKASRSEKSHVPSLMDKYDHYGEMHKKLQFLSSFMDNMENAPGQMMGARANQQSSKSQSDDQLGVFGASKASHQTDWIQNLLQIKLFLQSLNCQKPTPQQINVMNNSKQRLDLFKVLQAREHVKFTNIQSEKMLNFHFKLESELESRLKVSSNESQKFVNYLLQNGIQAQNKSQNTEMMNQIQQKQIQSMYNLQQLKNMRKQQQNDQKAFSIFQMNELAQFRSMSDGQQKQILLNNLQQGKFDDFENLIEPVTYGTFFKNPEIIVNSSKLSKNEVKTTIDKAIDVLKKSTMSQKQRNIDDIMRINSQEIKKNDMSPTKVNSSTQNRKSMLTPKIDDNMQETSSQGPSSVKQRKNGPNQVQSQQQSDRFPLMKLANKTEDYRQDQMQQLNQNFEISKSKFEQILKQNLLKQQRIKIFFQQMNEAFGAYFTNSRIYQQYSQSGLGIENLLPNVSKNILDLDEKQRARMKARQSMGISNLPRPIDRTKSKPNVLATKEPGLSSAGNTQPPTNKERDLKDKEFKELAAKKEEDKKDETKKEGEKTENGMLPADGKESAEDPVQEVKKPRYFPPKKLPNPFENAAQEQEKFLQARKEALAKYSMLSKNRFKQEENAPLKYVIRPGNNSRIIHKVMEKSGRLDQRCDNEGNVSFPGWETADDYYDSLYNFKWKPTSSGIKYDLISKHGLKQLVNHVRGHYALTTKDNLFLNMKSYYESQKQNVFDMLPFTIVLDYLKDDVGDKVETFNNILKIVDKHLDSNVEMINAKMQELQMQREKNVKSQYKFTDCMHDRLNLWLLKPTGFNRGIGIHIFSKFDELKDIMANHYGIGRGAKDKTSIFQTHNQNHIPREMVDQNGEKQMRNFSFVIQKLIERPLLYLNRKFDIRVWVLLNSADGKVYLYNEAYVRTSSKAYTDFKMDITYEEQIAMQLTNNAIQKENPEYGKYEEGNIISVDTLFNFVQAQSAVNVDKKTKDELKSDFNQTVNRAIQESFKSVKGKIIQQKYTFELFGYDFIIDEDLNTMLIEINTNPCLEESNKLLKALIPRMIDDCFNITMDPLFYPADQKYKSAFPLNGDIFQDKGRSDQTIIDKDPHKGYKDNENLFKLVYTMEQ